MSRGATFAASGPKVRTSLSALVKTWDGLFPPEVVSAVAARLVAPPASAVATGQPVALAAGREASLGLRVAEEVAVAGRESILFCLEGMMV